LALAGYISGGNQVLREASADPDFVASTAADSNITPQTAAAADRIGSANGIAHASVCGGRAR
jgi:hypothetical protein